MTTPPLRSGGHQAGNRFARNQVMSIPHSVTGTTTKSHCQTPQVRVHRREYATREEEEGGRDPDDGLFRPHLWSGMGSSRTSLLCTLFTPCSRNLSPLSLLETSRSPLHSALTDTRAGMSETPMTSGQLLGPQAGTEPFNKRVLIICHLLRGDLRRTEL